MLASQSKYEDLFLANEVKSEKHRALATFPEGDLSVVVEHRTPRTLTQILRVRRFSSDDYELAFAERRYRC